MSALRDGRDIRLRISNRSPEALVLDRVRAAHGDRPKWVDVVRTILLRYDQLLSQGREPTSEQILSLAEGLVYRGRISLLFQVRYPERHDVIDAIEQASHISEEQRAFILGYLSDMPFCEYARLIEAVEAYVGSQGGHDRPNP